jgi:hypothetical protein
MLPDLLEKKIILQLLNNFFFNIKKYISLTEKKQLTFSILKIYLLDKVNNESLLFTCAALKNKTAENFILEKELLDNIFLKLILSKLILKEFL